ncbi:MAG: TIGR03013 family PEP-CTERM/XrtA system glycosyltransferase [Acidobacteria bacterium]|nr:TIGR03013 family PEP-CTERM/XrtA system glycosyltransferase [Acidobacteriota bacterium]MBI3654991.1 TIGR03013 family PEP-CTERM/XrtA system glycosyltransferase [Acidobacteriota bacterium]
MFRIFNEYLSIRLAILFVAETFLLIFTLALTAFLRAGKAGALSAFGTVGGLARAIVMTLICQVCFYFNDLYDLRVARQREEVMVRLLQAFAMACFLMAALFYIDPRLDVFQGAFIATMMLYLVVVVAWRILFRKFSKSKVFRVRTLIVGSGEVARNCVREIIERDELGLQIIGFVDNTKSIKIGTSLVNPKLIGTIDELVEIVEENQVDKIIVAMEDRRHAMPYEALLDLKFRGIIIEDVNSVYEKMTGKIYVGNLSPSWLIFSDGFKKSRILMFGKRVFDIGLSLLGVMVCFPLALLIAALIKLDSKGPIVFVQERVGQNGDIFNIMKFRSMRYNAEEDTGPVWAQDVDERVTRVGRFLRLFRLDELPQFINVLRGDMSFVGPRPERSYFVEQLKEAIPYYAQRHSVKPGITGWAQVRYKYGASVNDSLEKLQYDLFYIKNMSLLFDLAILLLSIKIVISGKGAK